MMTKLRPVGSRVPAPGPSEPPHLPWQTHYQTVYTGSGTAALAMAVMVAHSMKPGVAQPQVILPAYGCPDLLAAVYAAGATPVLVDLLPDLPFMDPMHIREAISDRTVAVIAPGLSGVPERLESLSDLCREAGLFLIEDSAQCFPPQCARTPLPDLAVLSFGRGKPINLMGSGALLIRQDWQQQAQRVLEQRERRTLELNLPWRLKRWVFNALLSPAVFYWLERVPALRVGKTWYKPLQRIEIWDLPESLVSSGLRAFGHRPTVHTLYASQLAFLKDRGWRFLLDEARDSAESPVLRWPLLAPDRHRRDEALFALNRVGIGASALYAKSLPEIEGVPADMAGVFPEARAFADRFLTLPTHEAVTKQHLDTIEQVVSRLA